MISASFPISSATERRATNPADWIVGQCELFTTATGWTMGFLELSQHPATEASQLEWCWHSDVSDGNQRFGTMFLEAAVPEAGHPTFTTAFRLAELFTTQINQYLRLHRQVLHQASEIGELVSPSETSGNQFTSRLRALIRASVMLTGYRNAALFVLDPDGCGVRLRFAHQVQQATVPNPYRAFDTEPPDFIALQSGHCIIRRGDTSIATDWLPRDATVGVAIAVRNDSGPIGTLWLYDRRHHSLEPQELALLNGFGQQIADTFERLILLRDSETTGRLTRELDFVAHSTQSFLDKTLAIPGCEVAQRVCSHFEIGGDLFEVIPIDKHRTVIVVGDASGNSIPAAIVMTCARGALHALLAQYGVHPPSPPQIMAVLNQAIAKVTSGQQFISLVLGIFDSRSRVFEYTNAGHPPPIHVSGGAPVVLKSLGLVLGVLDTATYGIDRVVLAENDLLVLFSDGIVEARNGDKVMFSNDGIIEALADQQGETSATQVLDGIWSSYERHATGTNSDDRTLVVIRATRGDS